MDEGIPRRNGRKGRRTGMKVLGIILLALAVMGFVATIWTAFANGIGWTILALCGCVIVGLAGTGCLERSMDR